MIFGILFYICKKICVCFNFNGGSFRYLKLKGLMSDKCFWFRSFWCRALNQTTTLNQSGYCNQRVGLLVAEALSVGLSETRAFYQSLMAQIARALHYLWPRFLPGPLYDLVANRHTHTHTYIHKFIHTFIHSYIHSFIHTYIHTYMIDKYTYLQCT